MLRNYRTGISFFILLSTLVLSACGGGGGGDKGDNSDGTSDKVVNYPRPSANAGGEQYVLIGETVTLNGTASTSDNSATLSYNWSFLYKPETSTATINNADSDQTSFVPDVQGFYKLQLVVNDGIYDSGPSVVTVFTQSPVEINVAVPSGMLASDLRVVVNNEPQYLGAANSTNFSLPAAPQTAILTDSTNEPIFLGLINPGVGESTMTLDTTSTAVALVILYPSIASALNTAVNDYSLYISTITAMPETSTFAAVIQDQVTNNVNNWGDIDATFTAAYAAAIEATLAAIDSGTLPTAVPSSEQPVPALSASLSTSTSTTESASTNNLPFSALKYTDDFGTTEVVNYVVNSKSGLLFNLKRGYVNTRSGITAMNLSIANRYQRYVYIVNSLDGESPKLLSPFLASDGFITTPYPSLESDYIYGFGVNDLVDNPVDFKAIGPGFDSGMSLSGAEYNLFIKASALTLVHQFALPVLKIIDRRDCPATTGGLKLVNKVVADLTSDAGFVNLIELGAWREAGVKATSLFIFEYQIDTEYYADDLKCRMGDTIKSFFRRALKAFDIVDKVIKGALVAKAIVDLKNSNDLETWKIGNTLTEETPTKDVSFDYVRSVSDPHEFTFTIKCIMLAVDCNEATIDYGDGTTETKKLIAELTFTHIYTAPREYTVKITIEDKDKAVAEKEFKFSANTCTDRGFEKDGVSTITDADGFKWEANCVDDLLQDYPDSTTENPHYATAKFNLTGRKVFENAFTKGVNNFLRVRFSYYDSGNLLDRHYQEGRPSPAGGYQYLTTFRRSYYDEPGEKVRHEAQHVIIQLENGDYQSTEQGFQKTYHQSNGKLSSESTYVAKSEPDGYYRSFEEGAYKSYWESGNSSTEIPFVLRVLSSGYYQGGLIEGTYKYFHESGALSVETPYVIKVLADGSYQSVQEGTEKGYYDSGVAGGKGQLAYEKKYVVKSLEDGSFQGIIEGPVTSYYESGNKQTERTLVAKVGPDGRYTNSDACYSELIEGTFTNYYDTADEAIQSTDEYVIKTLADGSFYSVNEGASMVYSPSGNLTGERPVTAKLRPGGCYQSLTDGTEINYFDTVDKTIASEKTYVIKTLANGDFQSVNEGVNIINYSSGNVQTETPITSRLRSSGDYVSLTAGTVNGYFDTTPKATEWARTYVIKTLADGSFQSVKEGRPNMDYYASGNLKTETTSVTAILQADGRYKALINGEVTNYYDKDGLIKSNVKTYTDDILNGPYNEYYDATPTKVKVDGRYTDGARSGTWTTYNSDGSVQSTITY